MYKYLNFLRHIQRNGTVKQDRTGTGTTSVFGHQMRFDLTEGFPLVTTKACHLKSIVHELLWFLKGDTNVKYLQDHGVKIWDEWAPVADEIHVAKTVANLERWRSPGVTKSMFLESLRELEICTTGDDVKALIDRMIASGALMSSITKTDPYTNIEYIKQRGELGPVYGAQWRSWPAPDGQYIDQLSLVIHDLKHNPDSRRIIVSAWNVGCLDKMALAPCHALFQFYTRELSHVERIEWAKGMLQSDPTNVVLDELQVPKRALSCQLYQR